MVKTPARKLKRLSQGFIILKTVSCFLVFEFNILLFSEEVRKKSSISTLMENVSGVIGKPLVDLL